MTNMLFDQDTEPAGPIEADQPRPLSRRLTGVDAVFQWFTMSAGGLVLVITGSIGVFLAYQGVPTFRGYGWGFLTDSTFDPNANQAGILGALVGTIIIAIIALVVAFPLALAVALYISEYAPPRIKSALITLVDLMAAVPSLVFAAFGIFVLNPQIIYFARWVSTWFGWIPIFSVPDSDPRSPMFSQTGHAYGQSAFAAGCVVALMVIPLAASVMMNVFAQAPLGEREAAYALGATRWGMVRSVVVPFGRGGIIGGTMLGLGRALGETIAVVFMLNFNQEIKIHILQSGSVTISSLIATDFGNATPAQLHALLAAGFALFLLTLVVNTGAAVVVGRGRSGAGVDL